MLCVEFVPKKYDRQRNQDYLQVWCWLHNWKYRWPLPSRNGRPGPRGYREIRSTAVSAIETMRKHHGCDCRAEEVVSYGDLTEFVGAIAS